MTFPTLTGIQLPKTVIRRLLPLTVLTAVSVVGAAVVYVYGLKPAEERLHIIEQAYQTAKQAQADLQGAKAQQMRAQAAQRQLQIVRQALPKQEEFTSLALALSELAKREQVTIPGMSYDINKPEGAHPVKASISFKATGEYAAIYRFLYRLETADSYLIIESLDVASEQQRDQTGARVVVNIKVATYFRQEAA
jgi:hypothetical protein